MKLIVFTDLHYYAGDYETAPFDTQRKLVQYAMPMLSELVDKTNEYYRPDAVVNLGDSIQDAKQYDTDILSLSAVAQKFKEFKAPYYMVLGNHDLRSFDSFEDHKRIFGFDSFNYSVDLCGYHLVFITNGIVTQRGGDSSVERTRLAVKETVDWLRADLDSTTKPCILFNHFPFIGCEGLAERHVLENADELFAIIDAHPNVIAVASGHTHMTYHRERNGVVYHAFGSPIASLDRTGVPDAVYYEMEITDKTVSVQQHTLTIP